MLKSSNKSKWYSKWLQLGRTNYIPPWNDGKFHYHTTSQEIYYVIQGELWIIIDDFPIILEQNNLLLVEKNIPHALVGGEGRIQHYMMKIPHEKDEKIVLHNAPTIEEFKLFKVGNKENLPKKYGFFANLNESKNQNCWLIGYGNSNHLSDSLGLAYMYIQDKADAEQQNHPNENHFHEENEEWYFVINGEQELLVQNEKVKVGAHQLLKIPPNVQHKHLKFLQYPFQGMTIRVPNKKGDKVIVD